MSAIARRAGCWSRTSTGNKKEKNEATLEDDEVVKLDKNDIGLRSEETSHSHVIP